MVASSDAAPALAPAAAVSAAAPAGVLANCWSKLVVVETVVVADVRTVLALTPSVGCANIVLGIFSLPIMLLKLASITERFTVLEYPLGD